MQDLSKLSKKQLIELLKKQGDKEPETIEIEGFEVIPEVKLLGKSLNDAIEYANNPKNNVVLINKCQDVYKIALWVKAHKDEYPEFYKQIWEDCTIWADKLSDDCALRWYFGDWGGARPHLDSDWLPENRGSYGGVLLGRK